MTTGGKLEIGSLHDLLDRVPHAFTLSDVLEPDQPLVFMNAKFRSMTGCTDEHIGQNCRFLQADLENDVARADIKHAISEGLRTQVILRNRRMNGEQFHNFLLLEPIQTLEGPGQYVLGAQFELTQAEVAELEGAPSQPPASFINDVLDSTLKIRLEQRRVAAKAAKQLVGSWATLRRLQSRR